MRHFIDRFMPHKAQRRHAVLVLGLGLLIALATPGIYAQNSASGVLRGQVIDHAKNGPAVGATVSIEWEQDGKTQTRTTTTNEEGRYEFPDLPLADDISFTLRTSVDGRTATREGIALSTWTPEMVQDLDVYDTTNDPSNIHIGRLTIVLAPPAQENAAGAEIIEFAQILNEGDKSFADVDDQGRQIGLRYELPAAAHDVAVQDASLRSETEGNTIRLLDPIKPESTVLTLSYVMPNATTLDLSRSVFYGVREVMVLIGDPRWKPTMSGFQPGAPANIHGSEYATYVRRDVAAGTPLALTFKAGTPSAIAADGGAGVGGGVPVLITVLIGAIAIAVGGIAGAWYVESRRTKIEPPDAPFESEVAASDVGGQVGSAIDPDLLKRLSRAELEELRTLQLELIAELDDRHEAGNISEKTYDYLRGEQKARLAQVMDRLGS